MCGGDGTADDKHSGEAVASLPPPPPPEFFQHVELTREPLRDGHAAALLRAHDAFVPATAAGANWQQVRAGGVNGAVASFLGVTRAAAIDPDTGKLARVRRLDYEAYEAMAAQVITAQLQAARAKFGGLTGAVVVHRLGRVRVGEASLEVATSSPHRRAALAAVAWLVDEVKKAAPIWKRETFWADGVVVVEDEEKDGGDEDGGVWRANQECLEDASVVVVDGQGSSGGVWRRGHDCSEEASDGSHGHRGGDRSGP
ncbi:Molybdopterin synthase catalytic subunit [Cladochytrium tenue]|nr:Molybdopterin synthase catalytic subunit [Cladochytrium tenue]